MIVRVLDGTRSMDLAMRLEIAYRRLATELAENVPGWDGHRWEIAVNPGEPSVLFLSGTVDWPLPRDQERAVWRSLSDKLREVRLQIEGEVDIAPMFLTADPFAPGFFECEPDAWTVSGGDEPSTQVTSRAELDREVAARRKRISDELGKSC